jgi:hypothetical protein
LTQSYDFRAAADDVLRAIRIGEENVNTYALLCKTSLKGDIDVDLRSELDRALSRPTAAGRLRAYIHFLRGMVLLHYADMTPCREDVKAALNIAGAIEEDERRALLADLIDFLIEMATDENSIREVTLYVDTIKQTGSEGVAGVLDPLEYVLEYARQYSSRERSTTRRRTETVAGAQRILDNVPPELRAPVEEMVQKAKKNIAWWESRKGSRRVSNGTQRRKPASGSGRDTTARRSD